MPPEVTRMPGAGDEVQRALEETVSDKMAALGGRGGNWAPAERLLHLSAGAASLRTTKHQMTEISKPSQHLHLTYLAL
jgi:hypothetical protein